MQDVSSSPGCSSEEHVAILIPVFNDWGSLSKLLSEIDATLGSSSLCGRVTVVDDGSTDTVPDELRHKSYSSIATVEVIRLLCNLGHQRAIAVGLVYLSRTDAKAKAVVVMDGDGQDRAEDIPRLVAELTRQQCAVIFAARAKRSEEFAFRVMYRIYRLVHWLLTGISIRWGNFSAISPCILPGLLIRPDIWNHYAGAIVCSRIRFSSLSLLRGKRYLGESHMRYGGLIIHGLSGIAVLVEVVGVRLIILFSGLLAILLVAFGTELFVQPYLGKVLFKWATIATGVLMIFTMQGLLSILLFILTVLDRRSHAKIIPLRDAEGFIESVTHFCSGDEGCLRG